MAEDRKRGLTPEEWLEARAAFEAGESEQSLASRLHVDRKTIRSRKIREAWIPHITPHMGKTEAKALADSVKSNVVAIASHEGFRRLEESGVLEEMLHGFELDIQLGREIVEFALGQVVKAKTGNLRPGALTSEASESKDVVALAKAALEVRRLAAGRTAGEPTVMETSKANVVRRFRLVPPGPVKESLTG
jgi:hypothetical protein